MPLEWALSVDGSSNMKGSDIRIVLEGPEDILIEQALTFEFSRQKSGRIRGPYRRHGSRLIDGRL